MIANWIILWQSGTQYLSYETILDLNPKYYKISWQMSQPRQTAEKWAFCTPHSKI